MTEETGGQPIPSPPFFQSRIWEHGGGPASHLSLSLSHTHSNQPASRSEEGPDQNLFEYVCVHAQSFNRVRLFATPWTVAHQAPLSKGFSRQESCSGLPCPPPGDLPDSGIEPSSSADSSPTEPLGKPFLSTSEPKSERFTHAPRAEPTRLRVKPREALAFPGK